MIPEELREKLKNQIDQAEAPREQAINVMYEVQRYYGHLTDEGLEEAAALLGMTPLELEELPETGGLRRGGHRRRPVHRAADGLYRLLR
jgi:NADH:ubiquinone oxidoreductase subunit E